MKFIIVSVALLINVSVGAQKQDKVLYPQLKTLAENFNGDVGIYVRHLKSGRTVAINADSIFPTASMIKIPITIGMFNKIEKGRLTIIPS
jgi:beta-lactamase class A